MRNSYVLKRIFIGVAIGTILMFIRGCDVKASPITLEITPYQYCYNYYSSSRLRGNFVSGSTNLFRYNGSWNYCIMNNNPPNEDVIFQDIGFYPKDSSGTSPLTQNVSYNYTFNFYSGVDLNIDKVEIQYNLMGTNYRELCKTNPIGNVYERYFTVTCENIKVNSFNNIIHLYPYISDNQQINQAYIFLDTLVTVDEYHDVYNSLVDDNVNVNNQWDSNTSQNMFNQFTNVNDGFGQLFNLPVYVIQRLRNRLLYADGNVGFTISKEDLPFYSYLHYSDDFSLPPLRDLIYNLIGQSWYETLGGILGGLLIYKLLLKIGRRLLDMWSTYDTHNDVWGGIE